MDCYQKICKGADQLGKCVSVKLLWGRVTSPELDSLKDNLSCIRVPPQGRLQQSLLWDLCL